jgi:putative FmdB family regulatory protein
MPIYEYQCTSCGEVVEVLQKFSDAPLKKCKSCKKFTLRKLMGTPALQFKGSGWYITDYAGKNAANNGAAKEDMPAKSEKSETAAPACACSSGSCPTK